MPEYEIVEVKPLFDSTIIKRYRRVKTSKEQKPVSTEVEKKINTEEQTQPAPRRVVRTTQKS
jgi:hypothetical protein